MEAAGEDQTFRVRMTWAQIKLAYPDQWVVLGDLDDDEVSLEVHSAVVLGFGQTRRVAEDMAGDLNGETRARLFTGRLRSHRSW